MSNKLKVAEVGLSTGRWHLYIGPVVLHVEGDVVRWGGPNGDWLFESKRWDKKSLQVCADYINEHVREVVEGGEVLCNRPDDMLCSVTIPGSRLCEECEYLPGRGKGEGEKVRPEVKEN